MHCDTIISHIHLQILLPIVKILIRHKLQCVQFSYNVKQRNVLRNVPPAQMYVMSDAAVFVPGYLSLGGALLLWIPALSTPQTKDLTPVKNVLGGQKLSKSWKIDVSNPTRSWSLRITHDELNATIGISPRYLQSCNMARVTCLLDLEQMVVALDHHCANTFLLNHSHPWKCHQSKMASLWPVSW